MLVPRNCYAGLELSLLTMPRDALVAGGIVSPTFLIGRILTMCCRPKIALLIVQTISIPMVNFLATNRQTIALCH